MQRNPLPAFTLAELLIALAILGVIATFTIPKVLQAQQDQRFNAIAKEAAAIIGESYQRFRAEGNVPTAATKPNTIAKDYLNYLKIDTTASFNQTPNYGSNGQCSVSAPCYHLANGSILYMGGCSFGGTSPSNVLIFTVDPTGTLDNVESVRFFLHYNGKLETWGTVTSGSMGSAGCGPYGPEPANDPPWFSWD